MTFKMLEAVKTLNFIATAHEQDSENAWVETAALREIASYVSKIERALELYQRERTRFKHAKPEMTGAYFIAGENGNKDNNHLPDRIYICPAYGCDWVQIYEKTNKTSGPEY